MTRRAGRAPASLLAIAVMLAFMASHAERGQAAAFVLGSDLQIVGRSDHTATLLTNGDVLVVGGVGPGLQAGAAGVTFIEGERYSVATGAFAPTGPARDSTPRYFHTAVRLADGGVLVAGGLNDQRIGQSSASLYDPGARLWVATGPMVRARHGHAAALLPDGRVLITGGAVDASPTQPGVQTATAEIYDPRTGAFTATGSMAVTRAFHTATTLQDGRVLITGGDQGAANELFDPQTGTFSAAGTMSQTRRQHRAVALNDGRVLLVGGVTVSGTGGTGGALVRELDVYDPATRRFTAVGNMAQPRVDHSVALLDDGSVLITGGLTSLDPAAQATAAAETWDSRTGGSARAAGAMLVGRAGHTMTALASGGVLIVGGRTGAFGATSIGRVRTSEYFDPAAAPAATTVGARITSGSVPASGFGLFVFSGGTSASLVAASGCPADRVAFWATEGGQYITYIPAAAVAAVNAAWHARFAAGIPPNSALIGACRS